MAAVITADARTDFYNPNCIRASLGTVFTRVVCQAASGETLTWLRKRGCKIFAARPDAKVAYTDVDYRDDAVIVLGSEADGLSAAWRAADVTAIKLPMLGTADSRLDTTRRREEWPTPAAWRAECAASAESRDCRWRASP